MEVVEPQGACEAGLCSAQQYARVESQGACALVQSRAVDRPESAQQDAGWAWLAPTRGAAGTDRGGEVRSIGRTVGQSPSLPPLALLGASVLPSPASCFPVQAGSQRFWHWVSPSTSSGSAVVAAAASAQRVAEHARPLAGHEEDTHMPHTDEGHTERLSLAPSQSLERVWALGAGFGARGTPASPFPYPYPYPYP